MISGSAQPTGVLVTDQTQDGREFAEQLDQPAKSVALAAVTTVELW